MDIMREITVTINVNGKPIKAAVSPEESLLDFLRYRAQATEVKCGCNKGDCGTCTVILDDQAVKSCLVLAAQADNRHVWTVRGLEEDSLMQALQESFATHGAVQCGFCTPGMLMTAKNFLEHNLKPDRAYIKEAIAGNLCRCTGYKKIVDAIAAVAASRAGDRA
ncbi:[2Fe-2S]-binding [Moorella glycerini]|uniref:Carbon monoxide dehydrogenase small chain n=1 Tax=Neomoorella stamsii TaxID=1266720 RepID=A0A9X7P6E6_9FIRM|nr:MULTISPECIES: (2Fe-2S)-binding protein [Moorella]PRR73447.1 Carbon monoxide dehydrogenase small chain [Moorella stamsii]CEP69216.1 [2Fe-2S]-binding [Moorella glycerini]